MRYDPHREIYRDCPWCHGRGCLACPAEAKKDYRAAFPSGPRPIATFNISTQEGLEQARQVIGREALEHAFGPDGRGVQEVMEHYHKVVTDGGDAA